MEGRHGQAKQKRASLQKHAAQAYIELSTEKDASKITVVDVVNRADLSRNTLPITRT